MTATVLAMASPRALALRAEPLRVSSLRASIAIAGYAPPAYRVGETNRCPGCARSNFIVGRSSVECAFCATAMPIALSSQEEQSQAVGA